MRVLVLGGTRFIGRAIVEELFRRGHDVTVVHRGIREPRDMPEVRHLHIPRAEWPMQSAMLRSTQPGAVIDCLALTREDASRALAALPDAHTVLLSSQDIYRAFASLQHQTDTDAVPIDESSPLRDDRYPHRGDAEEYEYYSKSDVEEEYCARNAVVLRLPATYGEFDNQRREDFILRRVRAGRRRIPIGVGGLLWTRAYVRDVARGVCQAAEDPTTAGDVFNLGEASTWTVRQWATRILEAAKFEAELVTVDDSQLPKDMDLTAVRITQHVLVSSAKARSRLEYADTDPMTALHNSVAWHLDNPPDDADGDFSADDSALLTKG